MKKFIWLFLLVLVVTGFKCGSDTPPTTNTKPTDNSFPTKFNVTSPLGATVYKRGSAPTAEEVAEIDKSIERANVVAAFNGYSSADKPLFTPALIKFLKFQIELPNPACQNPGFTIEGAMNYDQSEWDKDPTVGKVTICAAERVWPTSYLGQCIPIVSGPPKAPGGTPTTQGCIPQSATIRVVTDPAMAIASYYGLEHQTLMMKDPAKYWQTQTHTNGQGHPLESQPPDLE